MKAKVIHGFYSFEKGRIIEKHETIEVDEERGRELMAHGLIVEDTEPEIDENGNFSANGEVIGYVEGDDIVITDPEVIEETLKDVSTTSEEKVEKKARKKAEK